MRRTFATAIACSLALATACTSSSDGRPPDASASSDPSPTRVLPVREVLPQLEQFVERTRGLRFKHDVKVSLLSDKAFLAKLHQDRHKPKPRQVEKTTAVLAAVGLISPDVNLVKAFRSAYDAGTLGFYDPKTEHLYVRGNRATPGVRSVLAHELTHALTDQWFGLRRPKIRHDHQELSLGWDALTEGDAERVRKAYEATLSPADRAAAERQQGSEEEPPPDVPEIVLVFIGFPYVIGGQFVDALVADDGTKALDDAYRDPPASSEQLLDPTAFLADDDPKHVAVPAADGPLLDHSDLGMIGLLLMLEHGLDRTTAQQSVVGWGGDQYAVWRAGDKRWCLRDTVVMDYERAAEQLDRGLTEWAAASHGRAHIEQRGARTTFVTCSS